MFATMRSEWLKLTTTIGWYVIALATAVLSWLGALIVTGGTIVSDATEPLIFLGLIGLPLIGIGAVLAVTNEYRNHLHAITLLATPNRSQVIVAKFFTYGLANAVLVGAVTLGCFLLSALVRSPLSELTVADMWTRCWRFSLAAILITALVMGVAMILRNTAATITVLLLWMLMGESLLAGTLSHWFDHIVDIMPGFSLLSFLMDSSLGHTEPWLAGVCFTLWSAGFFIIGWVLTERRDA